MLASGQLAVEYFFKKAKVVHAVDMASSPELRVHIKDGVNALHFGALEHFGVRNSVTPRHMEQGPETSHMEGVELLSTPAVDCPNLACIEQGW